MLTMHGIEWCTMDKIPNCSFIRDLALWGGGCLGLHMNMVVPHTSLQTELQNAKLCLHDTSDLIEMKFSLSAPKCLQECGQEKGIGLWRKTRAELWQAEPWPGTKMGFMWSHVKKDPVMYGHWKGAHGLCMAFTLLVHLFYFSCRGQQNTWWC